MTNISHVKNTRALSHEIVVLYESVTGAAYRVRNHTFFLRPTSNLTPGATLHLTPMHTQHVASGAQAVAAMLDHYNSTYFRG